MKNRVLKTLLPILILTTATSMADPVLAIDNNGNDRPEYIQTLYERIPEIRPTEIMSLEGQQYMQTLPSVGREDIHAKVDDWPLVAEECAPPTQDSDVFISQSRWHFYRRDHSGGGYRRSGQGGWA